MKKVTQIFFAATLSLAIVSCGGSKKEGNAALNDKKAKLAKLKANKEKDDQEILKLQEEISKLDTSSSNPDKIKLVATAPIVRQDFNHYIELQGKVDAENISYIAPQGQPGIVKQLFVKQGDRVSKGQLLLRLDNSLSVQGITSAKQQASALQAQLALAKTTYQRYQNLWNQGIGSQVQLLQYQTNVSALESQLAGANAGIRQAQAQANTANVYSDVSGVADVVNIRVGEIFSGSTANGPQIKIVNNSQLKVVGNIPENYLGSVQKGTDVAVLLPDLGKTINTKVSFLGASIDAINRGFVVEAKLPTDAAFRPNQIATIKINDYSSKNTIVVPLNTLQNDEKGKFVMVASTDNGKLTAHKRPVTIGKLNGDQLEITSGLKEGDILVTEGFASIYEGQVLTTGK
ncbi:efflux RND transporter periplasmic adaptor subunit [Ferruginibacter sp. HRS2-29]|uniref:efflux RND transporter periplasmic adaptor subunit n=1 Tax=Ferruginibacter sp. HRS2-29 TaxID=2487334 RepID=UPI0020CEEBAC|nr:efflux RND transporter periplasmic adaptor subunit [Ferruginibacter sp. HRS2-29]MCP9750410.1 efflux RND transporter periplasmic adaptor subunit [Ferruginibacter sp. HRS2-29]